jgi:hypothetical protein
MVPLAPLMPINNFIGKSLAKSVDSGSLYALYKPLHPYLSLELACD